LTYNIVEALFELVERMDTVLFDLEESLEDEKNAEKIQDIENNIQDFIGTLFQVMNLCVTLCETKSAKKILRLWVKLGITKNIVDQIFFKL